MRGVGSRVRGVVAALVAVAAGLGWWILSERALDRVEVRVGDWQCQETDVVPVRVAGVPTPAPGMRPGMVCRTRLAVSNRAGSAVTVESVLVPQVGDSGAPGVRLDAVGRRTPRPGEDAVVDFGQRLSGGTSAGLALEFGYRHDGCTPPGPFWVHPRVRVTSWGRSREVVGSTPVAFRGTPESDCWGKLGG